MLAPTKRPEGVPAEADWIADDGQWELAMRDPEGRRQGAIQRWRADGTKHSVYDFKDDRAHGPFRRWHDSGEPAREGVAVSGQIDGWDRSYRASGETSEVPFHRDTGPAVQRADHLYRAGEVVRTRYFLSDGTECESSGQPFPARPSEAAPDEDLVWSPGRGTWYSELSDGTGVQRHWSREGNLLKSSECLKGKRHGRTVLFRDDLMRKSQRAFDHPGFGAARVVRIEGLFADGVPIAWTFFDAGGTEVDLASEVAKQKEVRRRAKQHPRPDAPPSADQRKLTKSQS